MGEAYQTLVPAFDADGNGVGGIRLPELEAPLGTSQGWNPRNAAFGAADYLMRFDGSFWAFPLDDEAREGTGDPRQSVEARYPSKDDYVLKVKAAADRLVADRILLRGDGETFVENAEKIAWPPRKLDTAPFWAIETEGPSTGARRQPPVF